MELLGCILLVAPFVVLVVVMRPKRAPATAAVEVDADIKATVTEPPAGAP